jgi:hypothetical protein
MKKFKVSVMRTSYAFCEYEVEAENIQKAQGIADEKAGNYEYSERAAEYEIDWIKEVK